jgi:hypothetical protein
MEMEVEVEKGEIFAHGAYGVWLWAPGWLGLI